MRSEKQKLKLLYLYDCLERESSKEHPITTKDLIEFLKRHGITAERKSIYDDIHQLVDNYGLEIERYSSREGGGWYLKTREFDLPELKILVDAVQACRFIPQDMARKLIKKLEKKAGEHDAKELHRDVDLGSLRSKNVQIFLNIDAIHQAIRANKQISFVYQEWDLRTKVMVPRDDKTRIVSPWKLILHNEYYYLAAYEKESGIKKHYRVDKMAEVNVLDVDRDDLSAYDNINVSQYANRTFSMYGGKETSVKLNFPESKIGILFDRFGTDFIAIPQNDGTVNVSVVIMVSGQFFGWLAGIGKDAKIASPPELKEEYHNYLREILKADGVSLDKK